MNNNFNNSYVSLNDGEAPWVEIKNTDLQAETIHMSAANGFTVKSYLEFLNFFTNEYSITGMDCRGTWHGHETPPSNFKNETFFRRFNSSNIKAT